MAYKITLEPNGGDVGSWSYIWVVPFTESGGIHGYYAYSNSSATNRITSITPPTRSGFRFDGYYDPNGRNVIDGSRGASGTINTSLISATANETWTAKWLRDCQVCTVNRNSGTGGTASLYYADGTWYQDEEFSVELSATSPLTIPTRPCYEFLGCYSTNSDSGTKYINADGTPTAAFLALDPTEDIVVYAQWSLVSYKVTINHSGATSAKTVFYAKIGESGTKTGDVWSGRFYADDLCTVGINSITPPRKELNRWEGAWSTTWTSQSAVQYVESGGRFTDALYALTISSDKSLNYANYFTQVSFAVTQYASSGWTYSQAKYYVKKTDGGIYADWLCPAGSELTSLPIPSKPGYRYIGSYSSNNTTSTLCVDRSGVIQDYIKSRQAATTIYPQGRAATCTLTLDANGGTGGSSLYYDATAGDAAFFGDASSTVNAVTPPTYTGNAFLGYFTEKTGGTQVIDASGNILQSWTPTESGTVYAQWGIDVSIVDVDAGEGSTAGTSRFWYRMTTGKFYSDSELTQEITSVTPPSKRLFDLNGIYTDGDVLAVSASGVIQPGFSPSEEFVNLHAAYTRRCYETVVSSGGGASSVSAVYRAPGGSTWYAEDTLATPIANVGVPTRTGYTFGGYRYGGTTVISTSGEILQAASVDADYTANAAWTAKVYTLTFYADGATPSFASKSVTFGSAIGNLPTVSISGRRFESWQVDGEDVKSTDVWRIDANKQAVARWKEYFGGLTDWFNISNSLLMIVGSESGEGRRVTNLWNGAFEQGPGLVNPVCTYRVKASGNVTIRLGKAFASGFFITDFKYVTGADREPVLVVSGTANEGADAINLYDVTFRVDPDHVAQDPFGAVSGGGELVEMTSGSTCDPVVPYENNRPCASDVVHGRKTVSGTTAAYFGENPPTFLNSFIDAGTPKAESDVDFTTYAFAAERSI